MNILSREPSNTLPRTEVLTVQPKYIPYPLLVTVTLPEVRMPGGRLRGQLTLDGNMYCGTVFSVAGNLEGEGLLPATVQVSIGYPLDHPVPAKAARTNELTPLEMPRLMQVMGELMGLPTLSSGGGDRFLAFLRTELKPFIESEHGVDPGEWTLAGHSLGGLFTTYALFVDASQFRRYLAIGPSYWWRAPMMAERASAFAAGTSALDVSVYLAAGDGETSEAVTKLAAPWIAKQPLWARWFEEMGGTPDIFLDTQKMAEVIRRRRGVRLRCDIGVNETHGSAAFVAFSQGMRWLNQTVDPSVTGSGEASPGFNQRRT